MYIALDHAFSTPCRTFGSDMKIRVAPDTFCYPDATVACDDLAGDAIYARSTIVS